LRELLDMAAARTRAASIQNAVLSARLMNLFLKEGSKPIRPAQLLGKSRRRRRRERAAEAAAFDQYVNRLPEGK
jgi:hypothetical protein